MHFWAVLASKGRNLMSPLNAFSRQGASPRGRLFMAAACLASLAAKRGRRELVADCGRGGRERAS